MIEMACRAFILINNQLMLCKQKTPKRDFWTLPGGSVQEGETLTECVERELLEEISIHVQVDKLRFIRELIYNERHRIEFYFQVHLSAGDINFVKPNNEIEDIQFYTLDDLRELNMKPECLIDLYNRIISGHEDYPVYLGNIK